MYNTSKGVHPGTLEVFLAESGTGKSMFACQTNAYESEAPYEDGTLGLYNVIVPRREEPYTDKLSRVDRQKLAKLRDSVEAILGPLGPYSYIAGGALTSLINNTPINDIDVFGVASDKLQAILNKQGIKPTFQNSFVANYNIPNLEGTSKLQIIKKKISMFEYFNQLDNVANGILISTDEGNGGIAYLVDAIGLARRKLIRICNFAYPRQNLSRVLKYIARGWKIEVDSLAQLAIHAGRNIDATLNGQGVHSFGEPLPATLDLFSLVSENK
jgi:hypothetical protein